MGKIDWESEREFLEEKIREGVPYEELGRFYSVSGAAVKKACRRLGIKLEKRISYNAEPHNKGRANIRCPQCGNMFDRKNSSQKFCSKECGFEYNYRMTIEKWKSGEIDGTNGYSCSPFVRKYLFRKFNNSCQECGWGLVNEYTGKSPLQVHHIDGNSLNNNEDNLMLLCPNCHSLTENFGSRNKFAPRGKSKYYGKSK